MDYEGNAINFALERIVLKVNPNVLSGEFQSLVSRVSGKVIDDGRLPDPPSNINKAKLRPRFDPGYRLIGVSPVPANLGVLSKRLEKRGVKGVVKFSSDRAAALVNLVLQINDDESAVVSASPNLIGFPTAAFAEQTSSAGGYSSTENNPALAQLRLSGSGGAWDYKYAGVPVDDRGVQIAIIDTGFEPGNYDMTSPSGAKGTTATSGATTSRTTITTSMSRRASIASTEPQPFSAITAFTPPRLRRARQPLRVCRFRPAGRHSPVPGERLHVLYLLRWWANHRFLQGRPGREHSRVLGSGCRQHELYFPCWARVREPSRRLRPEKCGASCGQ